MTLLERHQYIQDILHPLEGISARRAYVSVKYIMARERFAKTGDDDDKKVMDDYEKELEGIDRHAAARYEHLRFHQVRYLVEYEGEVMNAEGQPFMKRHKVELFLLSDCDIDTYTTGWDLENIEVQEVLYEVSNFLLEYRMTSFYVLNIKRL